MINQPTLTPPTPAKKVTALVRELKENNQDNDFYPTTDEIINAMTKDMRKAIPKHLERTNRRGTLTFLDIGAGNGKVLNAVNQWNEERNERLQKNNHYSDQHSFEFWAIEKSKILIQELVKNHLVVGADFHHQSLINLETDIAFCNPPYNEYEEWTQKIIQDCNSKITYLVIPQRWKDNKDINEALKLRNSKAEIIGTYSFEDSEDRKARCTVNLLRIHHEIQGDELFDTFFNERFKDPLEEHEKITEENIKKKEDFKQHTNKMVKHKGLIPALVDAYNEEVATTQEDFKMAMAISPSVMVALGVEPQAILTVLKAKLSGLRVKYWEKLINEMSEIRKRLTSKNRESILDRIKETAKMDFNAGNIYAILMWVLEKANTYIDQQIIDIFDSMIYEANVKNYKSNQRIFKNGDWRYNGRPEDNITHISLEYRIVLTWGGLETSSWNKDTALSECGKKHLSDLVTVANALGYFSNINDPRLMEFSHRQSDYWSSGQKQVFEDSDGRVIFEVKAFKNRNCHIRLGQEFAVKLNATVGRLRGWIKSPKEAEEELGKGAGVAFNINPHMGNVGLLLTCNKQVA